MKLPSPPAILPNRPRPKRDASLNEMVDELDRFEKKQGALKKAHWDAVDHVRLMCQSDFLYASRNFFWIIQKSGPDSLFDIWPSQQLLWAELCRLRSMGRQQRVLVLKARQLGFSVFAEAMMAWRTMFNPNVNALVVSHSEQHSKQLYAFAMRIYDRLPWWLKPQAASRTLADGIWFENPDENARLRYPGLNSKIIIQQATQRTDIGQGFTLGATHVSEHTSWPQEIAKATIEDELEYALAPSRDTVAIIEATGEQPGSWAQQFWNRCVELGDEAKWLALFFPWFMEPTRILPPPGGWRPKKPEQDMREVVRENWVKCSECGRWSRSRINRLSIGGQLCNRCHGTYENYDLTDGQLCWMERERLNAAGDESVARLRKNLCTTPEEAWALSGEKAFPQDVMDYATACCNSRFPIFTGKLDPKGNFHAVRSASDMSCRLEWCGENHVYDEDLFLDIWELPLPGQQYSMGVDGSSGYGGNSDYTVIWINRIGVRGNPDVQVAMFRSNVTQPYDSAGIANFLGRWYNEALAAVEYNMAQSIGDNLVGYFQYPNIYQWRIDDAIGGGRSNRMHWLTTAKTKPKLKDTGIRFLRQRSFFPRSQLFSSELRTIRKLSVDGGMWGAPDGFHDDVVMAALIALYCHHQQDTSEFPELMPPPITDLTPDTAPYRVECQRCHAVWGAVEFDDRGKSRCPQCGHLYLKAWKNNQVKRILAPDLRIAIPAGNAAGGSSVGYPEKYYSNI